MISRKTTHLICFVSVFCLLVDTAGAATLVWIGGNEGYAWGAAANWSPAQVPGAGDVVEITTQAGLGPVIDESHVGDNEAICASLEGGENWMDVTGGSLTVIEDWDVGKKGTPTVNVSGGTVNIGDDLNIAPKAGEVTFNTTGGIVNVSNSLIVARKSGAIATLNMRGGTINCEEVQIAPQDNDTIGVLNLTYGVINADTIQIGTEGGSGLLNIGAGTLLMTGDVSSVLQGYIDSGQITAYNGYGTLHLDYDVTHPEKTTLTATHILNPNPADGSTASAGPAQLQWTLPEPNVPGGIVTSDVYFGTDPQVELNPKVVLDQTVESVSVTLDPHTNYYWAFDLYDSSVSTTDPFYLSPVFIFNTMNEAPVVEAGDDVSTWLNNGQKVLQLAGSVSDDDGGPGPATQVWTVVAEPDPANPAQISDPEMVDPTVALTALGAYTLQLEASDGEYSATDTLEVVLYADACAHAADQEGFAWIAGDINHDCVVDELDQAIMLEHWLQWNYSADE